MASSPGTTFATKHAQIKRDAEEKVDRTAHMTAYNWVKFQVHLSDAGSEATTWSITDSDSAPNYLEGEIYNVTSNEPIWF
jgi:hypothetical protein